MARRSRPGNPCQAKRLDCHVPPRFARGFALTRDLQKAGEKNHKIHTDNAAAHDFIRRVCYSIIIITAECIE